MNISLNFKMYCYLYHINCLMEFLYFRDFFPNSRSTAVLIPVFKKDNRRDPNNYRGIKLLRCLAKLFTNMINNRLIEWSKAYDAITDAQFGFRNGLSTADAIFALQTLISKSLIGKKKVVLCVCGLY